MYSKWLFLVCLFQFFLLVFICWVFVVDYTSMPELSCNHIVSSYWVRGKRAIFLRKEGFSKKDFSVAFDKWQRNYGQIYGLCIEDLWEK